MPTPQLGLVVRYGFVWAAKGRRPPPDAGKARPCVIVDLQPVREPARQRDVLRVVYLPLSHVAPRADEAAIGLPPKVAEHLGLTAERSFVYTSYAVEDDWPFDLEHVPGSGDRFDHGFIPPRLFAAIAADFARALVARQGSVHRRE